MCQRNAATLLLVLLPAMAACGRNPGVFSEQNARAHVSMLAGTIGSRPLGSEANARARLYVIDQLKLYGYDVRVQETDASRPGAAGEQRENARTAADIQHDRPRPHELLQRSRVRRRASPVGDHGAVLREVVHQCRPPQKRRSQSSSATS